MPDNFAERIRAEVSHPRSLNVAREGERIVLSGPVLDSEVGRLLSRAAQFGKVENQLSILRDSPEMHEDTGGPSVPPSSTNAPAFRLVVGSVGLGLAVLGWRRRDWLGGLLSTVGFGGIVQMVSGKKALGLIAGVVSPVIRVNRNIRVAASPDFAFSWWTEFSNFSRFMSYVENVAVNESGGIQWTLRGPAGVQFSWNARITRLEQNRCVEWKSISGAPVTNEGRIRFEPLEQESCRIDAEITYAPPAGVLGYSLVKLFGFDPGEKIGGDLLVMKELIESDYKGATSGTARVA